MEKILEGEVVSGAGIIEGVARVIKLPLDKFEKDQILVTEITNPQFFSK